MLRDAISPSHDATVLGELQPAPALIYETTLSHWVREPLLAEYRRRRELHRRSLRRSSRGGAMLYGIMAAVPTLLILPLSPWSERARWALDHHRLPYRTQEHAPFLGERRLRRLVGPRTGPVTVPILSAGDVVLTDSWDIAQYADRHGTGRRLFPQGREAEVRSWALLADETCANARALLVPELLRSPAALDELAPPQLPIWLRPALRPLARFATGWFARKYAVDAFDRAGCEHQRRAALDALRAALTRGQYLLDEFSYADIAMATMLQGVTPVADEYVPFGPGARAVWTHPHLAAEYADLLQWRDELYRLHRKQPSKATMHTC